ncbi:MAG: VCBS repeat-containing protein [Polyangiaceae bacterium]
MKWFWNLGLSHGFPIPGDFDGDGKVDAAWWDSSAGTFYVATSSSQLQQTYSYSIGSPQDWPVVKDWDGDWQSDFAVWHSADATWHINYSSTGVPQVLSWGNGGTDIPVDWFVPEYGLYPYVPNLSPYSQSQPTAPPSTPWSPSTLWSAGLAGALTVFGFSRLRRRRFA